MSAREIVELIASALMLGAVWVAIWVVLDNGLTLWGLGFTYAWGWGTSRYVGVTSERRRARAKCRRRIDRAEPAA